MVGRDERLPRGHVTDLVVFKTAGYFYHTLEIGTEINDRRRSGEEQRMRFMVFVRTSMVPNDRELSLELQGHSFSLHSIL